MSLHILRNEHNHLDLKHLSLIHYGKIIFYKAKGSNADVEKRFPTQSGLASKLQTCSDYNDKSE